jgi:amino-acid N-acetyltransferase
VRLRKAREADVAGLLALINGYAARNLLLPRTAASLRSCIEDFTLAVAGNEIVGCGALSALGPGLGEVRSLAVRQDQTGRGVGRLIVERLLREAAERGFGEVLALTRRVSFFAGIGFVITRRERFLDKLAADCAACPFNLTCDETAMVGRPSLDWLIRPGSPRATPRRPPARRTKERSADERCRWSRLAYSGGLDTRSSFHGSGELRRRRDHRLLRRRRSGRRPEAVRRKAGDGRG